MRDKNRRSIRVVVIDDSAAARELFVNIFQSDPGFEVIGTGIDGHDAVRLVINSHPDILLIDLCNPKMDGLDATRQIMREAPLPIVLISGSLMAQETDLTFKALQAGALAVIRKPGVNDPEGHANLIRTMRTMVDVPVIHHWGRLSRKDVSKGGVYGRHQSHTTRLAESLGENLFNIDVIGIAASTGGPAALASILKGLPKLFPVPILIVQHISKGFDTGLADWLEKQVRLEVVIASQGDKLRPGTIFLAPDDYHLKITTKGMFALSKDPPFKGLRPSANYLFQSLAKVYGKRCLGLILTGMGDDGVEGLVELRKNGGYVLAQEEQSCVVYGMPREAVLREAADEVLGLEQMAIILENIAFAETTKSKNS
jgi:two-component system chemotaxis response regulator CheB